ncbi:14356_t:CDS:2 [Entrophospora sp. SA101]|nr:14356_t:CDS:2 [Entrophospora sp. SA101]
MSDTPILSIEVVKKWKRANVVDFLKEKKEELELENEDIQIIDNNRVNGCAFLELNVDKLMQDGLKRGPAENITQLIKDIKGGKSRVSHEQEREIGKLESISKDTLLKLCISNDLFLL